jgi:imidazolonepropionase
VSSTAITNASQILTLAGPKRPRTGWEMRELGIVEKGAMLIADDKIATVGPLDEISKSFTKETEIIDAEGRVVLPGFVDAHTHLVFAGNRLDEYEQRLGGTSYQEIAAGGGGIKRTVALTRAASEDDLLQQAKKHAGWFLSCGTTTIEAKSGYGLSLESELKILKVIKRVNDETPIKCVPTFLGAHAFPSEFEDDHNGYVQLIIEEIMPAVVEQGLAEFCDAFCEKGYFTVEQSFEVLNRAHALGLGLRLHADQLTSSGGANLAAELGAVTADHLEQTDDFGIAALLAARVQPVLLPGSVYALGLSKYPAAKRMIDEGLALVLATDFNPGSSPTPSMPMILSLACTQMKLLPAEAISAATINAAYSLERGHEIGSLEPGKAADFVIFDCEDYREIPYYFGKPSVWRTFVGGEPVFAA